jgi:hypothetical protein
MRSLLVCTVLACGCTSQLTVGDLTDAAPGDDAGADVGPIGGVLVVHVTAWPAWAGLAQGTPAAAAVVALDAPGGARIEQTAGADGSVTFTGLDWSAGTAAVTAYLDDAHVMATRVGITEADGEIDMPVNALAEPELVAVNVTGLNVPHLASTFVMVAATVPGIQCQTRGNELVDPSCTLEVVPGQAFTIVAREYVPGSCGARCFSAPISAWTTADVPAVTGPAEATVDFAAPAAATTVSGSFVMPGRADSPLRSNTSCMMYTLSALGAGYLGFVTTTRVTADGSTCEYEGQYVTVPGADDPVTIYWVYPDLSNGADSWVEVHGNLAAGPQTLPFLDTPAFVTASGSPLLGPLAWTLFDAGVGVSLFVTRSDGSIVWRVALPPDTTAVTLPQLPASVNVAPLFGDGDVTVKVYAQRKDDATGVVAEATAAAITLTR